MVESYEGATASPDLPVTGPKYDIVAHTLVIPPLSSLKVRPDDATRLLEERVQIGDGLTVRRLVFRADDRAILRWHGDNLGVIRGMFAETPGLPRRDH